MARDPSNADTARTMIRSASLVAAGSLLGLLASYFPQDKPAQDKAAQDKPAQDQAASAVMPTPKKTGVHSMFAALVGEYDVALKLTMGDKVVSETKGTSKFTTVADGRFLMEENAGELMGKKYTGMRFYGWNAEAKTFEGTWAYSESNAIMGLKGKPAADRKSVEFEATVQETVDRKGSYSIKAERMPEGVLKFTMMQKGVANGPAMTLEETYTKKK